MNKPQVLLLRILSAVFAVGLVQAAIGKQSALERKPNIVLILADDLGYGDISCYNPESKIETPRIDALAARGLQFTDAHTNSSVCTPTRYGILTGRYSWRTRLKETVLYGYDKALIPPERLTVASFLQDQGYETACIGKWHLGWDWANVDAGAENIDFSQPIANGPTSVGFDSFYGIVGSLSMPPYVWVRDDMPTMVPSGRTSSTVKQSIWLEGEISEDFVHEQVLPQIQDEAVAFIEAKAHEEEPFFLYLPLTAPHNPILPTEEYKGRGGLGNPYADFVIMMDDLVGTVEDSLREQGVFDNTILIFVSDNGCSNQADFEQLASVGHFPSSIYRGFKADLYEGGHRVPFIMTWPDRVEAGKSDRLVCTTDFLATFAEILGGSFPENAGEDSFSFAPALGFASSSVERDSLVMHSFDGSFAYRKGDYKVLFSNHSGGWSFPRPGSDAAAKLPEVQLYNLAEDPGETNNLQAMYPELVEQFRENMRNIVFQGRSTQGPPQENDGPKTWQHIEFLDTDR
ncbi:arylsulfatase [Pelagicoccus sp. SDUM812005]|uniref:sulfatase family protein n=1 Tax=Pelagicoccus sp. SDUM812005 TaxID=3041257 RepID=UPI00280DB8CD|nr:arylsulfatase [Pelagicoccus sp. SDUM812005]MDQ8182918.1 arylsulfatase [Pelagicoccus sp. SDUM812005]